MKGARRAFAMMAGMVLSWSVYYAASKILVSRTGSALLTGMLLRLAALVFLTAQMLAARNFRALLHPGKRVFVLVLIGVFGFLLDLFANLGYASGSLSTGTALLKTDVLMVNLVSVIRYKKKLYLSDWAGTAVMLLGVLLVLGIEFGQMQMAWGDLFFILSALCVTANAFIIKAAQDRYGFQADVIAYYNNFVVLLLFTGGTAAARGFSAASSAGSGFWLLVLLGGLAQAGIYYFYYDNLRRYEVWTVKLCLLTMPVVSCFIGVCFLDEVLTPAKVLGILVVLAGAALILLRDKINGKSPRHKAAYLHR